MKRVERPNPITWTRVRLSLVSREAGGDRWEETRSRVFAPPGARPWVAAKTTSYVLRRQPSTWSDSRGRLPRAPR